MCQYMHQIYCIYGNMQAFFLLLYFVQQFVQRQRQDQIHCHNNDILLLQAELILHMMDIFSCRNLLMKIC